MQHLRVMIGFSSLKDKELDDFTKVIIQRMTGNAAYTTPTVTMANLQAGLTAFSDALAAQESGGKMATATKNEKRADLLELLRQLALYVEQNCNNDLPTLLSSGFEAVPTTRTQHDLEVPEIIGLTNGNSGQLIAKVTPIAGARCYEVRYAPVTNGTPGSWQNGGIGTNSKVIAINGLTPGTTYTVEIRTVGGTSRYSDWSNPVSHMSL